MVQTLDPAGGWIGSWSPGIGDPTFVGWITALAYLLVSALCFHIFNQYRTRARRGGQPALALPIVALLMAFLGGERRLGRVPLSGRLAALWLWVGVLLFLLGINKQLDLQTALTEIGRMMAEEEGWYERRAQVQLAFIVGVVLIGAWCLAAVVRLARGGLSTVRGVLLGTLFLMCFVAIRASSFHHVDALLGYHFAGFKLNWLIELGGIAFVGVSAYLNRHGPFDSRRRPA